MYQPKIREKKSGRTSEQGQFGGGVIFSFAQDRRNEAKARFREFIKSPISWMRENEPIRKALLLESLDILRPNVEVEHEHKIQQWKKRR